MNYIGTNINPSLTIEEIYTIHYFEYVIDFDFPGELHDFWEGVYVDAGEVTITAGTERIIMKQGEFFLHTPLEFHSIACNGSTANAIVFSFSSNCNELFAIANKPIKCDTWQKHLLSRIIDEGKDAFITPLNDVYTNKLEPSSNAAFGAAQCIKNIMELLLIEMIRLQSSAQKVVTHSPALVQMQEICDYIDSHLSQPLRFEDLCLRFSMGKTALKKIFRESLGCGAMEYYNKRRISAAKKMLREKKYSITEISDMLQFSSIHYFCRKFKQATNMTPMEYQRSVSSLVKNFIENN